MDELKEILKIIVADLEQIRISVAGAKGGALGARDVQLGNRGGYEDLRKRIDALNLTEQ